jgi:hypothetical protein
MICESYMPVSKDLISLFLFLVPEHNFVYLPLNISLRLAVCFELVLFNFPIVLHSALNRPV